MAFPAGAGWRRKTGKPVPIGSGQHGGWGPGRDTAVPDRSTMAGARRARPRHVRRAWSTSRPPSTSFPRPADRQALDGSRLCGSGDDGRDRDPDRGIHQRERSPSGRCIATGKPCQALLAKSRGRSRKSGHWAPTRVPRCWASDLTRPDCRGRPRRDVPRLRRAQRAGGAATQALKPSQATRPRRSRLFGTGNPGPQHNTALRHPGMPADPLPLQPGSLSRRPPLHPRRGLAHRPFERHAAAQGHASCTPSRLPDQRRRHAVRQHGGGLRGAAAPRPAERIAALMAIHVYQSSHSARKLMGAVGRQQGARAQRRCCIRWCAPIRRTAASRSTSTRSASRASSASTTRRRCRCSTSCSSTPRPSASSTAMRWQPGDLVIWDNRCLLHKANGDYDMDADALSLSRPAARHARCRLSRAGSRSS